MLLEDGTIWHVQPCLTHDDSQATMLGSGLHVDQDEQLVPVSVSSSHANTLLRWMEPNDLVNLLSIAPEVSTILVAAIADYIALAQAKVRNLMCRATRGQCSLRDSQRKSLFA